jgi:hypothetical protein
MGGVLLTYFSPYPQHDNCTKNAEGKVGDIALTKEFYIKKMTDKGSCIATNDTHKKVHTATFAFTTH